MKKFYSKRLQEALFGLRSWYLGNPSQTAKAYGTTSIRHRSDTNFFYKRIPINRNMRIRLLPMAFAIWDAALKNTRNTPRKPHWHSAGTNAQDCLCRAPGTDLLDISRHGAVWWLPMSGGQTDAKPSVSTILPGITLRAVHKGTRYGDREPIGIVDTGGSVLLKVCSNTSFMVVTVKHWAWFSAAPRTADKYPWAEVGSVKVGPRSWLNSFF